MTQKVIHVGVGVFGKRWCTEFLKTNIDDKTIEVVAVVDRDPQALAYGRDALKLPPQRCYADAAIAFADTPADFCTIAVTPAHHESVIDRRTGARSRHPLREADRR